MIDIDTNIDTSFKVQVLTLEPDDVYDWDTSVMWDVESVLDGDGLARVKEVLVSAPQKS